MRNKRFVVSAFGVLLFTAVVLVILFYPHDPNESRLQVQNAWQVARASNGYAFRSDITQTNTPLAQVTNIGRSSYTQQFHIEGSTTGLDTTDISAKKLQLTVWDQGGSVNDP